LPEVSMCVNFGARGGARSARAAPAGRRSGPHGPPGGWRPLGPQGLATRAPAPPGLRRPRAHVERSQGFGGTPRFRRDPKVLEEPQGFWRHLIDMPFLGGGGV